MSIVVSRAGAVALVEIDRQASLNALDIETVTELEARVRELGEDATSAAWSSWAPATARSSAVPTSSI